MPYTAEKPAGKPFRNFGDSRMFQSKLIQNHSNAKRMRSVQSTKTWRPPSISRGENSLMQGNIAALNESSIKSPAASIHKR